MNKNKLLNTKTKHLIEEYKKKKLNFIKNIIINTKKEKQFNKEWIKKDLFDNSDIETKIKNEIKNCDTIIKKNNLKYKIFSKKNNKNFKIKSKTVKNLDVKKKALHYLPWMTSKNWGIYNLEENKIIWGKFIKKKTHIASLTKIMTFLISNEIIWNNNIDPYKFICNVSKKSANIIGTKANLKQNDIINLNDLFYALLLPSGNDASICLAENLGKYLINKKNKNFYNSYDYFIKLMNNKSKELKLKCTKFSNPHGLSDNKSYSCIYDLFIIIKEAMKSEIFKKVINTKNYYCYLFRKQNYIKINWTNTNKLLSNGDYSGIKTGITNLAGPCLSSYNHKLNWIIIILNCKSKELRYSETINLANWYEIHRKELDNKM